MRARRAGAAALAALALLAGCTSTVAPRASAPGAVAAAGWDTTWEAPTAVAGATGPAARGFTDTTVRQVAHVSLGGSALRVTLSNVYGSAPLTVDRTTVATAAEGPGVESGSVQTLEFDGRAEVTVPAGAQVTSDPLTRAVPNRANLAVSTYLPGPTGAVDLHGYGLETVFTAAGDATTSTGAGFSAAGEQRYVLTDLQVRPDEPRPTVALFGDSITDGFGATSDRNTRYPDQLAALYDSDTLPAIANAGISGNMLLTDDGSAGLRGVERFTRDVVARPGVETCVVLLGINDINSDATASALADGYRSLVSQAHAAGIRVVGATILPQRGFASWTPARERVRQATNTFVRTSGVFDAVVDLDAALRDPRQPDRMKPAYDSGDHLHPGVAGYGAVAEAVYRVLQGTSA